MPLWSDIFAALLSELVTFLQCFVRLSTTSGGSSSSWVFALNERPITRRHALEPTTPAPGCRSHGHSDLKVKADCFPNWNLTPWYLSVRQQEGEVVVGAHPNKQGGYLLAVTCLALCFWLRPSQSVGSEYNCGFLVVLEFIIYGLFSKPGYSRICLLS